MTVSLSVSSLRKEALVDDNVITRRFKCKPRRQLRLETQ